MTNPASHTRRWGPDHERVRSGDLARKVLLVDDDETSRHALAEALESEGYEVVAAANGLEALDRLRWHWRPVCVVVDMCMPVMTGWELRDTMHADPDLRDIPVIGVTGGRWKPDDMHGFAARFEKPIKVPDLLGGLDRVWRSRHRTG